ncbi:hypothetical protein LX36DRAFT_208330 [Colletotrichum falcatum]|nr:hypothetical protein LX36DRAFT_208330 [Colletotrichum falcatum]
MLLPQPNQTQPSPYHPMRRSERVLCRACMPRLSRWGAEPSSTAQGKGGGAANVSQLSPRPSVAFRLEERARVSEQPIYLKRSVRDGGPDLFSWRRRGHPSPPKPSSPVKNPARPSLQGGPESSPGIRIACAPPSAVLSMASVGCSVPNEESCGGPDRGSRAVLASISPSLSSLSVTRVRGQRPSEPQRSLRVDN